MKGNTSHGFRKQFLTDEALKILHKAKELNPNGIYVFEPNGEIMTTDSFNRRLKKYCKEAGVPYHSSHKIRFYNASTAFDGNNLTTLSYLMGIAKRQPHSTIYGTSTRGRMTALLFKNWEFLHKVFKGVQTSGSKKEEKRCKFNISLTFTYCRRPESNRFKQSQILIERGFEDFITVWVFKKCSNVSHSQAVFLLVKCFNSLC